MYLEKCNMPTKNERTSNSGISGLVFVGCLMIGLAVGIFTNTVAVSILAGLGFGFIAMGVARYATGEW